jgi:hypothetical protein
MLPLQHQRCHPLPGFFCWSRRSYLDLTALGRQEDWEDSPEGYPQTRASEWWRRHDEYESRTHVLGAAAEKYLGGCRIRAWQLVEEMEGRHGAGHQPKEGQFNEEAGCE